jgi:diguanylate cyclase (GGDEF)-like protein
MKLYTKTALLLGGVFLAFTLTATLLLYISENKHIEDEGLAKAETLSKAVFEALYASMRQGGNRQGNQAVIERLHQIEDLHELRLIHGQLLDRQYGIESDAQPQDDLERRALAGETVHELQELDGARMVRYVTPVFVETECQRCHQAEVGQVIGAISVQVSLEESDRAMASRRNALLGWVTAALLGFGLTTYWLVQRVILRPLRRIQVGAEALAAGDLDHRLKMVDGDEISALAQAFNGMAERLQASYQHLEDQVHQRTQALLALNAVLTATSASLDLNEVYRAFAEEIRKIVDFDRSSITVFEPDGQTFTAMVVVTRDKTEVGPGFRGERTPIMDWIITHKRPRIDVDLRTVKGGGPAVEFLLKEGLHSWMLVPILFRGEVVGTINFASRQVDAYTETDGERLLPIAGQLGVALENARLYETERRRSETAAALLEVAEIVSSTLDFISLLKRLALRTAQVCKVTRCTIFLLDEDGEHLQPIMSQFADGHSDPEMWETFKTTTADHVDIVPLFRKTIRELQPAVLEDASHTHLIPRKWTQPFGIQKLLTVPLVRRGRAIGLMALDYDDASLEFTQEQIDLATTIGSQVAASIENAQLHAQTRQLSLTDELTGLANRRAFDARLSEEMRRARRYNRPLALIMADIDHFKHYNDIHGHPQGDVLLRELADLVKKMVRETDFVARYGGEEFVVILPETDKVGALTLAEKVRAAVAAYPFPLAESQPGGHLTISLGVSAFPEDLSEPEDLVQRADQALYQAKRTGRNRVC